MSRYFVRTAILLIASVLAAQQQQPRGVRPRSAPHDYKAYTTVGGVTYAASLVPADEVRHIFAFDISRTYVVLEVAVYPSPDSALTVDPDGFVTRSREGDPVHAADATTVASVIQQKNVPQPTKSATVMASTEVGYESGRDPYTGQRVHGTYTATQVGVGTGNDGLPPIISPGGYPQDRELLERQLWSKSLPGGRIGQPTAGYVYFPTSVLKKVKGEYELQYLGSEPPPVLGGGHTGATIQLRVPSKNH